jgi:four helix bundle protein
MSIAKRFEDLLVWQKSRVISQRVWELTRTGTFSKDYKLCDQINDATGSMMDNIAEGFERDGNKEFHQHLGIAKGSAGEVRSQLCRALDRKHINQSVCDELQNECTSVSRMLSRLMDRIRSSGFRGRKFNDGD